MPALTWGDETLSLPMLVLPPPLREGYRACVEMGELLHQGVLERSKRGVQQWIDSAATMTQQRSRRRLVQLVTDFLHGSSLEEADRLLEWMYLSLLDAEPAAQAARYVVRVAQERDGAVLVPTDDGDEWVWGALLAWVQAPGP